MFPMKKQMKKLNKRTKYSTYSDKGMMIERDGVRYEDAIDPAELNRQYTETDELIEEDPEMIGG